MLVVRTARSPECGFTLVEILVVIGIIGLLVGLTVPAVMSAREASRRAECLNHLKQMGIALEGHQTAQGRYPHGIRPDGHLERPSQGTAYASGPLSVHVQLLPYLDQPAIYSAVNFAATIEPGGPATWLAYHAANSTTFRTAVGVFLCPSDPSNLAPGNNYRACMGSMPGEGGSQGEPGSGAFQGLIALNASGITDGLSSTVGLSERLRGSDSTRFDGRRDLWFSGLGELQLRPSSDEMLAACSALTVEPVEFITWSGQSWAAGRYPETLYNHVATPNRPFADCSADHPFGGTPVDISQGTISARSAHPGGVHAAMMDGSVRFVRDAINPTIWRSLATRAGGEAIDPGEH